MSSDDKMSAAYNFYILVLVMGCFVMLGSDGAAALVLVSGKKAVELGLQVVAKIRGYGDAAQVLEKIAVCICLCITLLLDN